MFADIEGYTALMQKDVEFASKIIRRFQRELEEQVIAHRGTVVNFYGDGALCTFQTPVEAVRCAMKLQNNFKTTPNVPVRIGIHSGTVTEEGEKIFGDSVNLASRIESMGVPGSILLSKKVRDDIKNHADLSLQGLGKFHFKNVEESVEVFVVTNEGLVVPQANELKGKFARPIQKRSAFVYLLPLLLLVGLAAYFFTAKASTETKDVNEPIVYNNSIAFLQLDDLSATQDQQYLGDAIITEMISLMGQIPNLKVIGHNSSFYFADKDVTIPAIGKQLGVNYLVAGSFARNKGDLKLNLNLLDATTGEIIKLFRIDTALDDIFSIQENLALNLAAQIKMKIKEDFFENQSHPQREAYLLTHKALNLLEKDFLGNIDEVEELLLKSFVLDSSYTFNLEQLYFYYLDLVYFGKVSQEKGNQLGSYYLNKLLEIDSLSAEALNAKAIFHCEKLEFDKAKGKIESLISKDNLSIQHLTAAGVNLGRLGSLSKGIEICEKAMELDPLYVFNFYNLSELYYLQEKYNQSITVIQKAIIAYPETEQEFLVQLSHCYLLLGKIKKAKDFALTIEDDMWKYRALTLAEYGLGNTKISDSLLIEYIKTYGEEDAYYIAACYNFKRVPDEAFKWLNRSIDQKELQSLNVIMFDPLFKNLHLDPRWKPLLKRLGFPEVLAG